jgi:type VI secretion system protein ImpA
MAEFNLDALLSPLAETAPCGADLEYDPAFLALEEAARGKPEQQFGDTIIAAQEPDWRVVDEQSRELFGRTKDLRIVMHWLRARTRMQGLRGFATTLPLVHGLLERYWDQVFPMLDVEDNNDPTMRLNALAPLADPGTVIADLRSAALGSARIGLRVRDVELAGGKAQPEGDEQVPSPEGVTEALRQAEAEAAGLLQSVRDAHDVLVKIDALVTEKASTAGPDLRPLRLITQCLAENAARAAGNGDPAAASADAEAGGGAPAAAGGPPGALRSREDAIRMLDRVCDWIERNEPSNPAPLLIRRAQRLMSKNFLEIIRDLIPEGMDQVTKIAGVVPEE